MTSDFSNITVVTVTGEAGPHGAAAAAPSLLHSAAQLPGSRILMISPERPRGLPAHVEHRRVKPFGYIGYSVFMLYCLDFFIETDFALIVQKDGWVLDGKNWRDQFFEYDYIGAPSVSGLTVDPAGLRTLHNKYKWQSYIGAPDVRLLPVYNGGLSFRSRKLMNAPRRLGLTMNISPPDIFLHDGDATPLFEIDWPWGQHTEDTQLCAYMREALEADSVRFAPLDLALDFSFEYIGDVIHADYDFARAFGTHCKFRTFLGGHPPIIDCRENRDNIEGVYRQAEVNQFLKTKYGYNITI